jgi:cytochrome c-type biogenesis protein CcmH/NrfF
VRVVNEHATPHQKPGMALELVIGKLEATWEDHAREFSQQASAKNKPGVFRLRCMRCRGRSLQEARTSDVSHPFRWCRAACFANHMLCA